MTISKQDVQNLFYKACQKEMLKLVAKCIEHGSDPTANDNYAIQWASHNGHVAVVKLLLEQGADPTVNNNRAIKWASENGHIDVVEILEKHLTEQKLQHNIR